MGRRSILLLGGVRSGKSDYALQLAAQFEGPHLFVATAEALDQEMLERIRQHRAGRSGQWQTLEAPLDVGGALRRHGGAAQTVIVDCLTLLVSNVLATALANGGRPNRAQVESRVIAEIDGLIGAMAELRASFVLISNEVGLGVVPPYPAGRLFRDILGLANQRVAAAVDTVYLMMAGVPLALKGPPLEGRGAH